LLQIPIFFAMFKVISINIEMRHAPFFGWIQDLSAHDPTSFANLFGLLPFTPPGFLMIGAWPCLMLVLLLIQQKLNPPPDDPTQRQPVIELAQRELGWQPTVPLEQGLEPTIAWFRQLLADGTPGT
jgi:membrane protein insertase Oxa1/YidC/SpoIIIJ